MHPLVWIGILLGGLAIWRRNNLKDDTEKVKSVATGAKTAATDKIAAVRGGSAAEAGDELVDEITDVADAVAAAASDDVSAEGTDGDEAEESAGE